MWHQIYHYFDKLEDRIRGRLSRYPIFYSLIGGTAIVLFWRGVWITADEISYFLLPQYTWLDGPISLLVSALLLLGTGLFVSFFVSDQIIMSGIRQEKKIVEKTEAEVRLESDVLADVQASIEKVEAEVRQIDQKIK